MPFFEGFLVGLAFIGFFGPVFFTLIYSTLEYGWRSGLAVVAGIFTGDALGVLVLEFLGIKSLIIQPQNMWYIGIIGGIIVIGLGIKFLVRPQMNMGEVKKLKAGNFLGFWSQGFLVNFVNPFLFAVWLLLMAGATSTFPDTNDYYWFLAGVLLGIPTQDASKVLLSHKIKYLLSNNWLKWIYRSVGIILVIFGTWIMFKTNQNPDITQWETPQHTGLQN
ncbi:MAG: LysE family transporter [Bacteroidia bacterium]|nr:LysE family transporter [Bacteroidia bacterium]